MLALKGQMTEAIALLTGGSEDSNPEPETVPGTDGVSDAEKVFTKGTISFYNAEKGYGFIKPSSGSEEIFMHSSQAPHDQLLLTLTLTPTRETSL